MAREFSSVGVVGLGTMGAGIAEVFARNGIAVVATEIGDAALAAGRTRFTNSTDRAVARGRLAAADRDALHARVTWAVGLDALAGVDLVIEAVPERLDLKRRLFADLDRICQPEAILATNTSSLSVTEIAVATGRPEHVVGVHFFNPAPVMKLVEVVRTVVTAPEVVADVRALCRRLGKTAVTIADRAGFVANALLFGYLNQAAAMYEAHQVDRESLDAAMTLGAGLPMGPLALMDLIGLDTTYEILDTMYRHGGRDRRHAPVPLIRQLVSAGLLGRKTGRGFYTYAAPGSSEVVADDLTPAPAGSPDGAAAGRSAGTSRSVENVGVVGGGVVAGRIAEAFAGAGFTVVTASGAGGLDDLAGADLVVDTVGDDPGAKTDVFAALDAVCKPGTVLATTSASAPVIGYAMASGRPDDVVGLHFVTPGLVEVVRTVRTSPAAFATAGEVVRRLGAHPVACGDRAGFVVEALWYPYLNDAVRMLEAGYATVDDIDAAMTLGCGYPQGPFAALDSVGLDVALAAQRRIYHETREPGLAPAPLLEHLVTAGHLGRSAGRGFRDHTGRQPSGA